MTVPRNTPNWIVALTALGLVLYWLRDTLAPFALAVILWVAVDGLASSLQARVRLPGWLAQILGVAIILGVVSLAIYVLGRNLSDLSANGDALQLRIETLAHRLQRSLGFVGAPWTLEQLLAQIGPAPVLRTIANIVQGVVGQATLVLIYLVFLIPAGSSFSRKLTLMIPDPVAQARAVATIRSITTSIQSYLAVQGLISLLISVLSYGTLLLIGLPNALFWAILIFFLNFVPTLGSIVAVALPTLFALVSLDDWRYAAAVALGLHVWQFGIGNFVQPRLTGASLNLSVIVVILSLALWGALWGVTGVFLGAPLMVIVMIVLEQFPATHWIAVLLSANGRPAPARVGDPVIDL